ncbi:MAG: GntR family transcriptional regulator [Kribbellaceae bacterium]
MAKCALPSATDDALQPYQRIAADLRGAIDSGRPGELLPSEKELATRYGVAASTAHRAVAVLVRGRSCEIIPRRPSDSGGDGPASA